MFSTVPGAPVFVGKSPKYRAKVPKLGIDLDLKGHNALQSTFVFDVLSAASSDGRLRWLRSRCAARLAGRARRVALACPRALLLALSALAWATLWWWSASPYSRYLAHGGWSDLALVAALCRARARRAPSWCRRCCTRSPGSS